MKKFINLWLMAALVCGLGMSVTSCDDDDNTSSEEQQQKEAEAKAEASEKFWSVVGQLISYTDIVDDYEGKTFEPNIGRPAANDPLTRIVGTNTMEAAVQSYNDLTGANITASTATHTHSDPDVGSLTWTKTTDGSSWATVDVNIKQLPTLTKIVYQSFEQGNENGFFQGKAYYRFGDVIQFGEGTDADYWICVRPAFGFEKKEDSHWVNIGTLDTKEYKDYSELEDYNHKFWLPTKLGTNKTHMQNFAEMLYAICFPAKWHQNVGDYCNSKDDLLFFKDFSTTYIKYHNQIFWQNVQNAWVEKEVITKVLNLTSGLAELQQIEKKGVHLMYNGYSWPWGKTCTLYEAVYTNGTKNSEQNLHHAEYLSVKKDMSTAAKDIDFRNGGSSYKSAYEEFFSGTNREPYRWVIRHATGEELSELYGNGRYDVKQPIDKSRDFYRYYAHVYPIVNLLDDPEEPVLTDHSDKGNNDRRDWNLTNYGKRAHYKLGQVYKDEEGSRWIVVSMSGRDDGNPVRAGANYTDKEPAPYSELVSFDGLLPSDDGKYIANLANYARTIRTFYMLHNMFQNTGALKDDQLDSKVLGKVVLAIREATGVDMRYICQLVGAKSGNKRNCTHLCSVAYLDPNTTTGQTLMRFLYPIDLNNERPPFHFWTNYVANPNDKTEAYNSGAFGNEKILLQHVADQNYVTKYGPDFYATQPVAYGIKTWSDTAFRSYRTKPDSKATNPTNYFYNNSAMVNETYPADMWNEPVLMYRTTAVYDRGEDDHATITVDGQKLTLFKSANIYSSSPEATTTDDIDETFHVIYGCLDAEWSNIHKPTNWLNGLQLTMPTWVQAWGDNK